MISLIVNADDLGSNPERDRGIFEAFRCGIVTSASLLANGASFSAAAAQAKEAALPVGVHLNLSEGMSLTGEIKGLTGPGGQLPGKQQLRQCLAAAACEQEALRKELAAQIERCMAAGLTPDHLDSHQHCQVFPCLTDMLIGLAKDYGISAMRTTLPGEPAADDPPGPLGEELSLYRNLSREAHEKIIEARLKTTEGLWGMPLLNRLDAPRLRLLLETLPNGTWELMTHPGYPYPRGNAFDGAPRYEELHSLVGEEAREVIARRRIRLCTFRDLPCAF